MATSSAGSTSPAWMPMRRSAGAAAAKLVARGAAHQPNQVGERSGAHLLHDVRAVHLDGLLGGAELQRDLLVQLAGDHAVEHLALAARQAAQAVVEDQDLVARVALR